MAGLRRSKHGSDGDFPLCHALLSPKEVDLLSSRAGDAASLSSRLHAALRASGRTGARLRLLILPRPRHSSTHLLAGAVALLPTPQLWQGRGAGGFGVVSRGLLSPSPPARQVGRCFTRVEGVMDRPAMLSLGRGWGLARLEM